jgi:hypothetical protein
MTTLPITGAPASSTYAGATPKFPSSRDLPTGEAPQPSSPLSPALPPLPIGQAPPPIPAARAPQLDVAVAKLAIRKIPTLQSRKAFLAGFVDQSLQNMDRRERCIHRNKTASGELVQTRLPWNLGFDCITTDGRRRSRNRPNSACVYDANATVAAASAIASATTESSQRR